MTASAIEAKANAGVLRIADASRDVAAADLDLTSVTLTRNGGAVTIRFTTRGAINSNVIYSAVLAAGDRIFQVSAKRAAGTDSFFVFRYSDYKNVYVRGSFGRNSATVNAPLSELGGANSFQVYASAEPTNGRKGQTDRAPKGSKSLTFRVR